VAEDAGAPTISTMTTDALPAITQHSHASSRARRTWHFARHYVEMVVAMFAGMFALGALEGWLWPGLTDRTDVAVLVMATNMSLGMGAWMRVRGHSWRGIAEMSAAMYLPFAVLLVPFWAGAVDGHAVMSWGHVLMFPAMALAMLLRPAEYAH
jgi:hypothetical protein